MLRVREARPADVAELVGLARKASHGLTSLPADAGRLEARVAEAGLGRAPLLVLEDPASRAVVGTAGLWTHVGDADKVEPFYAYRVETSVFASKALGVRTQVKALHLVADFEGPTEIGTLFLDPAWRRGGVGRLLSLSRFLYLAHQPERFDRQVIAELRGVVDEHGRSPFWDAVGRHFFGVDYTVADQMCTRDKTFIAELMPRHPIYIPLLPEEAQRVIGQVHPETVPAKRILEQEGFHSARMVDIFDAGPVVRCDRDAIRTIRDSWVVRVAGEGSAAATAAAHLVSRVAPPFLAVMCPLAPGDAEARLPAEALEALGVGVGDGVRVVPAVHRAEPAAAGAGEAKS